MLDLKKNNEEVQLGRLLTKRGWTLSVVETTTGGLICSRIVGVPGSSAYFERGLVAYSKASKIEMLGINEEIIETYGAVSKETATALAEGVRRVSGTTFGLAETGMAGPIRGRSLKPVGSAFISVSRSIGTLCQSYNFDGDREKIRRKIANHALTLVLLCIEGENVFRWA